MRLRFICLVVKRAYSTTQRDSHLSLSLTHNRVEPFILSARVRTFARGAKAWCQGGASVLPRWCKTGRDDYDCRASRRFLRR